MIINFITKLENGRFLVKQFLPTSSELYQKFRTVCIQASGKTIREAKASLRTQERILLQGTLQ